MKIKPSFAAMKKASMDSEEHISDEVKENSTLRFEIEMDAGTLTGSYFFRPASIHFENFFAKWVSRKGKRPLDPEVWQFCIAHAEETLKKLVPQILSDALTQVIKETDTIVVRDLNDTPFFIREDDQQDDQLGNTDPALRPVVAFALNIDIDKVIEGVAESARKDSRRRMGARGKGGRKSKLRNCERILIDERYEELHKAAKEVFGEYSQGWKRFRRSRECWQKDWLKIASEKFPKWKEAFRILFNKKKNKDVNIKPSELAFMRLSLELGIAPGTVENLVKEARKDKRRMLKQKL